MSDATILVNKNIVNVTSGSGKSVNLVVPAPTSVNVTKKDVTVQKVDGVSVVTSMVTKDVVVKASSSTNVVVKGVGIAAGISEAPHDDSLYGRKNGTWEQVQEIDEIDGGTFT